MSRFRGILKSVVKRTEKQLQSAPDLEGRIQIEGKEYTVVVFMNMQGALLYLSR